MSAAMFGGIAGGASSEIDRFLLLKNEDGFLLSAGGAGGACDALTVYSIGGASFGVLDCLRPVKGASITFGISAADERADELPKTRLKKPCFSRRGEESFRLMLPDPVLSRTNSLAWSLTSCGMSLFAERRSD
jgi:hypothetical protein